MNEAELAFETMKEMPADDHFFGWPHMMERYETAFHQPLLSNRVNHNTWIARRFGA